MDPPITFSDFLDYENHIAVILQDDTTTREFIAKLNEYSYLDSHDNPISMSGHDEDRVLVIRPDINNHSYILKPLRTTALYCGYTAISASDILQDYDDYKTSEILNLLDVK